MTGRTALSALSLAILFAALAAIPYLVEGAGFLALASFAPLFCMEEMLRREKARHKGWYCFTAFALFNIAATYWIWYVSPAGAVGALTCNSLFMTAIFAIFIAVRNFCCRKGCGCTILPHLIFICIWVAWEHAYHEIELSWPWLTLGNSFATSTRLVQWYDVTGAEGGSLWILLSGLTLFLSIRALQCGAKRRALCHAAIWAVVVTVPTAVSLVRFYSYREEGEPVEVVAVQPNVDPFAKYGVIAQSSLDERLIALADSIATPATRYIITPETFTYDIDLDNPGGNLSFARYCEFLSSRPGTSMLLGALSYRNYGHGPKPTTSARRRSSGWTDVYNSAMMFDAGGEISFSNKSKLVPGVEIIPYQDKFTFLGKIFDHFGGSTESYGRSSRMEPLEGADGHVAAPMICYESIYSDYSSRAVKAGADFLAVITNDGWWGDSPGYHQHFRYAKLRAIENRRDLVQVANNGISGFIDQKGEVLSSTPYWVETAIRGTIHTRNGLTFFSMHGDFIGRGAPVAALALLLLAFISCASGRKSLRGKPAADKS